MSAEQICCALLNCKYDRQQNKTVIIIMERKQRIHILCHRKEINKLMFE